MGRDLLDRQAHSDHLSRFGPAPGTPPAAALQLLDAPGDDAYDLVIAIAIGTITYQRAARHERHEQAYRFGMLLGMLVGMSVQIAIRLPDDMVAFLDQSVAAGNAPSRAALVARAVEREMRREAAERDAAILQSRGAADDLDELVAWAASHAKIED